MKSVRLCGCIFVQSLLVCVQCTVQDETVKKMIKKCLYTVCVALPSWNIKICVLEVFNKITYHSVFVKVVVIMLCTKWCAWYITEWHPFSHASVLYQFINVLLTSYTHIFLYFRIVLWHVQFLTLLTRVNLTQ